MKNRITVLAMIALAAAGLSLTGCNGNGDDMEDADNGAMTDDDN